MPPRQPKQDLSKLPQWAQNRIAQLEREAAHWKAEWSVGPEDSNTFVDPYINTPKPLGTDPSITFKIDSRQELRAHLVHRGNREDSSGTWLEVSAYEGILHIRPSSANTVYIRVTPPYDPLYS